MSTMPNASFEDRSDPRHLRVLFERASALAEGHGVSSVFVGIAGREGDTLVRDFIDFVEAELRVEDHIFRLLRERAVLLIADVAEDAAMGIVERLRQDFASRFPTIRELEVGFGTYALVPGGSASAKDILPGLFDGAPRGRS
jgi:hypothetical protein